MIRYDIPLDLHSEGYLPLEPLLPYDGPLSPEPVVRQPYDSLWLWQRMNYNSSGLSE